MRQQTASAVNELKLHLRQLANGATVLSKRDILLAQIEKCEQLALSVWGRQTPREWDELADELLRVYYRVSEYSGFKVYYTDRAITWAEVCGQDARKVQSEQSELADGDELFDVADYDAWFDDFESGDNYPLPYTD